MALTGGVHLWVPLLASSSLPWITGFHLVLGSLLIGLLEGVLLAALFRAKLKPAVVAMILANYASAFASWWLAPRLGGMVDAATLDRVSTYHGFAVAVLFLAGFLSEWPFVLLLLRARKVVLTLAAAFAVQIPTWIGLVLLYSAVSQTGLLAETRAVSARDFASDLPGRVYFLGAGDGDVWAVPIRGGETAKVVPLGANPARDRLIVRETAAGTPELVAIVHRGEGRAEEVVVLLTDLSPEAGFTPLRDGAPDPHAILDLRPPLERAWAFRLEPGRGEDIVIENRESGVQRVLGFTTPLVKWSIRNVTVLPGDRIVFEAGGRILLLERDTGMIAQLARGASPVVAPEP